MLVHSGCVLFFGKYNPKNNVPEGNNPSGYIAKPSRDGILLSPEQIDPAIGRFINADGLVSTGQGIVGHNMFAYCLNNPVNFRDINGEEAGTVAAASGVKLLYMAVVFVAIVVSVKFVIDCTQTIAFSKKKNKYNPDAYSRPNEKKQGRENKNKNRKKEDFIPRNNRRDNMPAPPKHHTPMKDHQKFSQSRKTKIDLLYKTIG